MDNVDVKDTIKKYISVIIGLFIIALSFNLFFLPFNLVVYDANGLAVIVNKFIDIDSSVFIFVFEFACLIFGFIFLGIKDIRKAIMASALYPVFVKLTEGITNYVDVTNTDMLLVAILAGVTTGIGNGLVFKSKFNSGGTDLIELVICKYFKWKFGKAVLLVDGSIVLAGGFIFGYELLIYALIALVLISIVSDKIMLGINDQKVFYIVSDKKEKIKDYLLFGLNKSVTEFEGKGFHGKDNANVLMCVVKTRDYFKIKEGILEIDKDAFLVISNTHELTGSDRL